MENLNQTPVRKVKFARELVNSAEFLKSSKVVNWVRVSKNWKRLGRPKKSISETATRNEVKDEEVKKTYKSNMPKLDSKNSKLIRENNESKASSHCDKKTPNECALAWCGSNQERDCSQALDSCWAHIVNISVDKSLKNAYGDGVMIELIKWACTGKLSESETEMFLKAINCNSRIEREKIEASKAMYNNIWDNITNCICWAIIAWGILLLWYRAFN